MHSYLQDHPSLIQAIKKLEQLNPDQFEVYLEHRSSKKFEAKNQMIDSLTQADDVGMAIRVIKDGRLGFSYTTSLECDAIYHSIETAFEIAQVMPEDPHCGFYSFSTCVYPSLDNLDVQGLNRSLAEKSAMAISLERACKETDCRIQAVRSASIIENSLETHLVDSSGEHISHRSSGFVARISCKAEEDGDSQTGGDFDYSNYLESLDLQETAQRAARWATEGLGAKGAPTLKCPAVLRNSVVAGLLEFLAQSFSIEKIEKKRSLIGGKLGEHLLSSKVTLIDDGLLPGGAGTAPFDAEGVPTQKTILVDSGLVNQVLYDNYYARKHGKEPTGTSTRGIKSPPSIGYSNLYLKKGQKSLDSLFDGISKGILITELMGLHTANPVTGDFSLGACGVLIENGKCTKPVRGFAIAGNLLDLFRRITDIGQDLRFFGRIGAPAVRISEISVGGV